MNLKLILALCFQVILAAHGTEVGSNDCRVKDRFVCNQGWVQHGRKCFKLLQGLKTFDEAEQSCRNNNGVLASIASDTEHNFLLDYILRDIKESDLKSVWIGGKRKKTRYIWMDLEPFTYMDWHSGNANFLKSDLNNCVTLQTTTATYETDQKGFGKFLLQQCNMKNFFICQKHPEVILPLRALPVPSA